jgi:hypothetical protein
MSLVAGCSVGEGWNEGVSDNTSGPIPVPCKAGTELVSVAKGNSSGESTLLLKPAHEISSAIVTVGGS